MEVPLIVGVSKRLYPLVLSRSDYNQVKLQRRTRGTFMSAFSNKSFSHYRCVEAALLFSAVAQRLE